MIYIEKINETYMRVKCERYINMELSDYFKFKIPNAQFNPKVKNGLWDGFIRLFNMRNKLLYIGLLEELKEFFSERDYEFEVDSSLIHDKTINHSDLNLFVESLNLSHTPRDYQLSSFKTALEEKRRLFLSPTASGKSLIIYLIIRFFISQKKKVLIIVPTTSLVHQMDGDFKEYNNGIDIDTHKIMGGKDKESEKSIFISTWQSIYKLSPDWFDQFHCVIGDECHLYKATCLKDIMEKCLKSPYKFGFTGSLDDSITNKMVLKGLFGPVKKVASTVELIDRGFISNINIKAIVLDYSDEIKKFVRKNKKTYFDEVDFLIQYKNRNKFITKLTNKLEGNTLVLFRFVEKHGKPLSEMISESANKPTFFVHGGVDSNDREEIRKIVIENDQANIVASLGTMSTGTNIPNINNIILSAPTKSKINLLQSIGRGLRLVNEDDVLNLFDISDDLRIGKRVNYTFKHFLERVRIYDNEGFNYSVYKRLI